MSATSKERSRRTMRGISIQSQWRNILKGARIVGQNLQFKVYSLSGL
jgi:hypothetical protein